MEFEDESSVDKALETKEHKINGKTVKISRREQDAWAERSQRLYSKALIEGKFAEELIAIDDCVQDEHPRPDANRQS